MEITETCKPMGMQEAKQLGMIDFIVPEMFTAFDHKVEMMVESLAQSNNFDQILESKVKRRNHDEFVKPLKYYRQEELKHMREDFFMPNAPYNTARRQFVYKIPQKATPSRLALHRYAHNTGEAVVPFKETKIKTATS
jgi:putative two-component system hydrogenase maturation factor HypX/HoxX